MIIIESLHLENLPSKHPIKLKCEYCGKIFISQKNLVLTALKGSYKTKLSYCSLRCGGQAKSKNTTINLKCQQCNKEVKKKKSEIKESKSGNVFCSKSCAATYNNTHKTTGTRISKLELWLQQELIKLYNFEFHFNRKDTINSELDVYIPFLRLAFELNGIFHYEPIYGEEKLSQIQNNDHRKFQACLERGIEFVTIDTSSIVHFKIDKAKKYLDIITNLINKKLGVPDET